MRFIISIIILFFSTNILFGQTYTISGHVKLFESNGKEGPISVILDGINLPTKTDHTGRYVFELTASQIRLGDSFSIGIRKDGWKVVNPEKLQGQLASQTHELADIVMCKENDQKSCNRAAIFFSSPEVQKAYLVTQTRLLEMETERNALINNQTNDILEIADQVTILTTNIDSLRKVLELQNQSIKYVSNYVAKEISKNDPSYFFERAKEEIIAGNYKIAINILNYDNLQRVYNEAILDGSEETIELAINNYLLRANLEVLMEKYDDAYVSLVEASKRTEDNLGIIIEMANVSILKGKNQSIELYNKSLERAQNVVDSALLYYFLGASYRLNGEFEQAAIVSDFTFNTWKNLSKKDSLNYFLGDIVSLKFFVTIGDLVFLPEQDPQKIEEHIQQNIDEMKEALSLYKGYGLDSLYQSKSELNFFVAMGYNFLGKEDSVKKYLQNAMNEIERSPNINYLLKTYLITYKLLLTGYIEDELEYYETMGVLLNKLKELPLPDPSKIKKDSFGFYNSDEGNSIFEGEYLTKLLAVYTGIFADYHYGISPQIHKKIQELDLPKKYYELLKRSFLLGTHFDKWNSADGMSYLASMEYKAKNIDKAYNNINQTVSLFEYVHRMVPNFTIGIYKLGCAYESKTSYSLELKLKKEATESADRSIELFNQLREDENAQVLISREEIKQTIKYLKKQKRKASSLRN